MLVRDERFGAIGPDLKAAWNAVHAGLNASGGDIAQIRHDHAAQFGTIRVARAFVEGLVPVNAAHEPALAA
jgi:hypothetical protein